VNSCASFLLLQKKVKLFPYLPTDSLLGKKSHMCWCG